MSKWLTRIIARLKDPFGIEEDQRRLHESVEELERSVTVLIRVLEAGQWEHKDG